MTRFLLRRLTYSLVILFVASLVTFAGVRSTFDPTARLARVQDPTVRAAERERLHLDDSLITQYTRWLGNAVGGDFGITTPGRDPVSEKIGNALGYTLPLVILGTLISLLFALSIGIFSAVRQYSVGDYLFTGLSYLGIAMPPFWFAYIAIIWLSVKPKGWFGLETVPFPFTRLPPVAPNWAYVSALVLPVMTLTVQTIASWSRFTRASMLETLNTDYVRTAKAKGVSRRKITTRHALRNALIPVVTVIALDTGILFGGLIITESIFSIPGMGSLFISSLENGDAETLTAWVLVTASIIMLFNLLADLCYGLLDPRVRTT